MVSRPQVSPPYSWGLDRIDQRSLPLDGFYNPALNGSGTKVYVVDTGLDCTHPELLGRCENVFDAFETFGRLTPNNDGHGHGTHCAGTVAGTQVGVSPQAQVLGVKVLDDDGSGTTATVLSGLEFIYKQSNRAIVSMSIGGICDDILCVEDPSIIAIDEFLTPSGYTVVVAAANDACDACVVSPAAAWTAITVGATDRNDTRAYYSNHGKCVDVYAPGSEITSACASGSSMSSYCDGEYLTISGTSMATPHVAGIVAQWRQFQSNLTTPEIMSLIQDSGVGIQELDQTGGRPVLSLATLPEWFLSTPTTNPWAPTNGYLLDGETYCDKGYTNQTCEDLDPRVEDCGQDPWFVLYMVDGSSDVGWQEGVYYSITGDLETTGTLACNYAGADQFCLPGNQTSVVLTIALCADTPITNSFPILYIGLCEGVDTLYWDEFLTVEIASDGRCIGYTEYQEITDPSMCPYRTTPTLSPTLSPTPTPTQNPDVNTQTVSESGSVAMIAGTTVGILCVFAALAFCAVRERWNRGEIETPKISTPKISLPTFPRVELPNFPRFGTHTRMEDV